jgi:hypothetical protein
MASFPDFGNWSSSSGIGGILSLPNASYPYYWAWILGGIWSIIVLNSYFLEKSITGKGNILSSLAVASFAILILSILGTLVGFISLEIMLYVIAISMILLGVWWFSGSRG